MSFHIGQKVVCINDKWDHHSPGENHPTKGQVLTIRNIGATIPPSPLDTRAYLRFVEIENPHRQYRHGNAVLTAEVQYFEGYFAPLESKSIEIFRKIAQSVTDGKPLIPDKLPKREYIGCCPNWHNKWLACPKSLAPVS